MRRIMLMAAILLTQCVYANAADIQLEDEYRIMLPREERFDYGVLNHKVINVSFVQLLGNPKQWNGRAVMVEGILNLEFEGDALYLSKCDYEYAVTKNAIWIDIDITKLREIDNVAVVADGEKIKKANGEYVLVEGVFRGSNLAGYGHMGLFSGELKVTRIARFKHKRN